MIYEHLQKGKEHAIGIDKLMELTRLNRRDLYRAIAEERKAGYLICGSRRPPGGFYIANDQQEAAAMLKTLEKQAKSMFLTCRAFRDNIRQTPGQMELDDLKE